MEQSTRLAQPFIPPVHGLRRWGP